MRATAWLSGSLLIASVLPAQPLRLHGSNPHYFEFQGKPTVLITSGEHYGALINLDFDYALYFQTLARDRLNLTRVFTGAYREVPGNFSIAGNTLAPKPDRFLAPWPRSAVPGAADGLNKFDLSRWNESYFSRLKDLLRAAGKNGVIVELVLFCPFYEDSMWEASPMNARNNVNNTGAVARTDVYTLKDPALTKLQEDLTRRIVSELRGAPNLYFEIANEPYFGGITLEWQGRIAAVIREAETGPGVRHLISQNIANGSKRVPDPNPDVSIFNFHYSRPPEAVGLNWHLARAIGNNETGFDGASDATYRIQGWDFLLAGGALYNNLDYSFAAGGHEDGTFMYPADTQPGGGSAALRAQLRVLRDFMDSVPFTRMEATPGLIRSRLPAGASAQARGAEGQVYAIYVHHGRIVKDAKPRYQVDPASQRLTLTLGLPDGTYRADWIHTRTGGLMRRDTVQARGGEAAVLSPAYTQDIALRLVRPRPPAASRPK
ncbi:MAG: glycoside hydrolase family 5 protein [Acidobacteria bacterium]|nr:glycoside hydrolase family 5 protein [Acidobacteriota bacterium]